MKATHPPVAYLDHAASSPLRPEVAAAMAPYGAELYGNPSSSHQMGRAARRALDEARERIGWATGTDPAGVVFTSGGTEADNLAIAGTLAAQAAQGAQGAHGAPGRSGPPVVVCSAVEHPAVLRACQAVAAGGFGGAARVALRVAPVDGCGRVRLDALGELLGPEVVLVSVMTANHEVGTIQPLAEVLALVRERAPGALVHTDAVQAAPTMDLARCTAGADLVSMSAHKLGGPKGTGALLVRGAGPLHPLLVGGEQERGRRAGTQDVAGIVGLDAALAAAGTGREAEVARLQGLRDRLAEGIAALAPQAVVSGPPEGVLASHCHVRLAGYVAEELLFALDQVGICASAGAACASGALEPSHVLEAMGVGPAEARGALRFTLGHTSGPHEVERVLACLPTILEALAPGRGPEGTGRIDRCA